MEGQERVEVLGATTTKLLRLGFQAQQIGYRYLREALAGQSIQENATRPTNREMISLLAGSVSKER